MVLLSYLCFSYFPNALVEILPSHDLDHNSICLSCEKAQSVKSNLFHFQAAWLSHPDYVPLVENTWRVAAPKDATARLDNVKDKSITFNKNVFGNIFHRKRPLEA